MGIEDTQEHRRRRPAAPRASSVRSGRSVQGAARSRSQQVRRSNVRYGDAPQRRHPAQYRSEPVRRSRTEAPAKRRGLSKQERLKAAVCILVIL
ncbi:MAG: hypothetical protein J6S92_08405, partial [Oscillospiraceae bacterium]|nr:hypothetical protein [Oscillospiraceae bacterium]